MADQCPSAFEETLISGYLDGELTQSAEQRVRIHLEDCAFCREFLADLQMIREAAMSTEFAPPEDDQWDERPRSTASFLARGTGWLLAVVWLVGVIGYGLWQFWQSSANVVERVLVFGGLSAVALLFCSVALDRIASARTDPYREVER
jgi:predicted anti-sigma-YlaC factor YlaD